MLLCWSTKCASSRFRSERQSLRQSPLSATTNRRKSFNWLEKNPMQCNKLMLKMLQGSISPQTTSSLHSLAGYLSLADFMALANIRFPPASPLPLLALSRSILTLFDPAGLSSREGGPSNSASALRTANQFPIDSPFKGRLRSVEARSSVVRSGLLPGLFSATGVSDAVRRGKIGSVGWEEPIAGAGPIREARLDP